MVGVFCLWSSSGRCVYVDTRCGVCRGCALGSGIGVGSEFAVSDVCSDGCDWAWGRVVSVGARGVCVGGTRSTGGVSSADDVRVASVLRVVCGDGGVCEVCICLARGGV